MYKNDGVNRGYSEGFKHKILAELNTGKYSKRELGKIYGINRNTINVWVKKDIDKLVLDSYLEVSSENLGYKNVDELKKT